MTELLNFITAHPLLPVFGLLMFDSIAMSYITTFSETLDRPSLLLAIVFEVIAWIFLVLMIRYRGLAVSNAIWDVGSLVIVTLIAIMQFKERLVMRHFIGIILGILSVLLLLEKE
jgi:multidrug transporter EmrE-like cation transporter